MMKSPHPARSRLYVLVVALGLMLLLFLIALYDAQVLHGSENRARSIASNATEESVEAFLLGVTSSFCSSRSAPPRWR